MKKVLLGLVLLASFGSNMASANLLVNGSFEDVTGGLDGAALFGFNDIWYFDDANQLSGWTRQVGNSANYYAEVRDNAHLSGIFGLAQDGTKFLELDTHDSPSNGGVTQTLSGLTSGGSFDLSFWYSARPQTFAPTNDFDVYWNGNLVQSFTNLSNNTNDHQWVQFSTSLIGDVSGTNTLSFAAAGTDDVFGVSIDDAILTESAVAAVPEPETYAMFLAGLGLLGVARRKKYS